MDDSHPYFGIVLFIIFMFIDAVLYCFQSALENANEAAVTKQGEVKKRKTDKILALMDDTARFGNTLDITIFITNVVVGAYILRVITDFFEDITNTTAAWMIYAVAVVMLILLIVLGVLVPKRIGLKYPEKSLFQLYRLASIMMIILLPVSLVVGVLSSLVLRLIGINPNEALENVTEEEIITMVNEGQEQGIFEASEAEMINNIFEFGDKEAHDVMIHRSNIKAIDGRTSLDEAFRFMLKENYSRYPVYDQDIDNIVGMIYLRDATQAFENEKSNETAVMDIPKLLREAHFIPETRNIDALFKEMQAKKIHAAIVVDEYGQTAGLVTMEDIIEEIVGNILDEYDEEEELIEQTAEDSYEVDGFTLLEDIEDLLGIKFEDDEYETINGFMISSLHRLPEDNEEAEVEYGGYNFKILEAANKVIRKIKITKLEKQEDDINGSEDTEVI